MSEHDRAAKAARARALLKKRQQAKATGPAATGDSRVASPSPAHSRPSTPAIAEVHPPLATASDHGSNGTSVNDLFTNGNGHTDSHWLSSLDRVETPSSPSFASGAPPTTSPPPRAQAVPPSSAGIHAPKPIVPGRMSQPVTSPISDDKEHDDLRSLIQDQARVIASLEAERNTLAASAEQLKQLESRLQQANDLLGSEQSKTEKLQGFLEHAEQEVEQMTNLLDEQKDLVSTLEQEKGTLLRQLAGARTDAQRSKDLLQEERGKVTELQDVIQNMEEDLRRLENELLLKDKSISSLQFEKANLSASVERLKGSEAKFQETLAALKDERTKVQIKENRLAELEPMVKELTNQTDQQQKTISVLVSEKNALSSSVERLQDAESKLDDTTTLLQAERSRADRLQTTVNDLTVKNHDAGHRVSELAASEKALTDKTRDLERELHALNTTVGELRTQSAKYQRRIRELEEQIDSDDRAERLEETLRNTQNRADELEFQVSKLQQAQSTVRSEREQLDSQLRILAESEGHWKDQHAELDRMYQAAQDQILAASAQRDTLRQEKSSLEKEVATGQTTLGELQQKLAQSVSELNVSVRVLQQTQAELKTAQRRADEAEKAQSNLQAEGIALMRSLEEMRPKIVELTDAKLDLGEKVEGLTRSLRARDDTIAQLESELDELRDQHANGEAMRRALDSALEKERTLSQASTSELHQSHSELTKELERLRAASHTLEEERSEYRQMASQHMQEVQKLTASVQTTADQLSSLRSEVEERKQAQEEAQEVLERARGELEMLRAELSTKEEHIERLHEFATKPTPTAAGAANALGDEILSAMRQQHELELSEAQSEIRSLETAVYEAESHALAMQRQVAALETQLSRPNSRTSHQQRPSIPPARFSSNRINTTIVDNHYHRHPSDDLRRASFSSVRNANANHHVHPTRSTSPPSAFEGLSAETRHKRRVSLGMLKARIDSEAAAAAAAAQSWRTSSPVQKHHPGLPTVVELPPPSSTAFSPKRTTVYLDDSHVFWCHSCKGDLVIL